jgi:hypothetical protein
MSRLALIRLAVAGKPPVSGRRNGMFSLDSF